MSKKIFILNNFKDSGIDRINEIRDLAKKSGAVVSDYLYRYDKAKVASMLTSDNYGSQFELKLFIQGLFSDIDDCNLIYWIHGDKVFDQLNRIIIARFIAVQLKEAVAVGDIYKIINNFVITDEPINDDDYEFIQACIIFSQYYLNWLENGGIITDKKHAFNTGRTPLVHFNELKSLEFDELNSMFNGGFEEFDISVDPEVLADNPPTIRADNAVYYGGTCDYMMDAWLSILAINYFETSVVIYVLSLSDPSNLVKSLCNSVIRLEKDENGFHEHKDDEPGTGQEVEESEVSNPDNQ